MSLWAQYGEAEVHCVFCFVTTWSLLLKLLLQSCEDWRFIFLAQMGGSAFFCNFYDARADKSDAKLCVFSSSWLQWHDMTPEYLTGAHAETCSSGGLAKTDVFKGFLSCRFYWIMSIGWNGVNIDTYWHFFQEANEEISWCRSSPGHKSSAETHLMQDKRLFVRYLCVDWSNR